ncbi:alpha-(1,3)-fucosyltransferase fut-5-like isoform X2 [Mercenaria mercenaria]|uniref:alpha-(1,3)-fucosyltransferase fut-5-like isoform X2 n=1 Tax=Mercenaria mercenaria TaxID=6596 RepID=UPI00234EBDA0|nr:alpha-(1,3)-fucosyltransferase fut-5-like isoform X2 [Mercenaria mercenaria]
MKFFERMKPRCTAKYRRIVLICFIPMCYIVSTMFYVTTELTSSYDINYLTEPTMHVQEMRKWTFQTISNTHNLSFHTQKYDRKFVDVVLFQHYGNNQYANRLRISWLNKPRWLNIKNVNDYLAKKCPYWNCIMTETRHFFERNDALIFNTMESLQNLSQLLFYQRPSKQVWVFFQMEPPTRINIERLKNKIFHNSMNWSWSYRLNSDIFRPIRTLAKQNDFIKRDYAAIFKRKTKMAAWVVSHCQTQSLRETFVSRLVREGISVDIFGSCSKQGHREDSNYIQKKISNEYKYYLSLENSFCEDYITEKFFTYFGLDVVLIVRGSLNYSKYFDKSAFIDTTDFSSVKELAKYMLTISKSEYAYTHYLRNKEQYIPALTQEQTIQQSACQLCAKLNNADKFHNIYDSIENYVNNNTCFKPNDYH